MVVIASALCVASCQIVRPQKTLVLMILPPVDAPPPFLIEWKDLAGARPTTLSTPGLFPESFLPAQGPRVDHLDAILANRAARLSESDRKQVIQELLRSEKQHGLDAVLLLAMIEQESSFDPRARGPKGSLGLMQVRPFVGRDVAKRRGIPWQGPETLHDPAMNIRIGTGYFAELKQMYPDDSIALAAYNMGPYRVKRILAKGRIPVQRYTRGVLRRYRELRSQLR
jgi:soluble lytic murein transglycosylase-like protein